MYKSFKYKLKPTKLQKQQLEQIAGASRFVYNYMLNLNIKQYEADKKFVFKVDMCNLLPKLKKQHAFLKDVHSQSLQQKCIDLDSNLKKCYKNKFGFPKFKSKKYQNDSFRIPQNNTFKHIKPKKKQIKIPKLGWIKYSKHTKLEGLLKSITIKQELDNWYVVCLCEVQDVETIEEITESQVVGIDLGLIDFAVTSDNTTYLTPKFYRKAQKKLAKLQRQHAKKQKRSKNKNLARRKIAKLHRKTSNQRKDFTHKASNEITNQYKLIGVEDLNVKGMTKNKNLSKSINDQGWSMFLQQLEYKSKFKGGSTIKIDRFYPSSKTCSDCGRKHDLTLKDRVISCDCGLDLSRDLNAAINIKAQAVIKNNRCGTHRIYACGDTTVGLEKQFSNRHVSTKQEKPVTLVTQGLL